MNSIIFPTICLNNSGKIAELWIKCTVWRRGSCAARGYSLALMMSGDGGWVEGEVVSVAVIFWRIKNTRSKQRGGPERNEERKCPALSSLLLHIYISHQRGYFILKNGSWLGWCHHGFVLLFIWRCSGHEQFLISLDHMCFRCVFFIYSHGLALFNIK